MIDIQSISKKFSEVQALKSVSLQVQPGEIVGLLGANGAGKTTLLRILYGLIGADSGAISVDGVSVQSDPDGVRAKLGVLPDSGGLYQRLTARENMAYFGRLYGVGKAELEDRIEQCIKMLEMQDIIDRRCQGFSLGQRTKVALARAILHKPDYLMLDEPTNGLDVLTTRAVRELLLSLKAEGRGVLFSSHLMHEVANLCDRVIIIREGAIVMAGSVDEVINTVGCDDLEEAFVQLAYGDRADQGQAIGAVL